ncbi:MAG: WXG100 family type VII secretion target [Kineosporiaceae bacterium]
MTSGDFAAGLPAVAAAYAERLARYLRDLRGEPEAIHRASQLLQASATREEAIGSNFRHDVGSTRQSWTGPASDAFGAKSGTIADAISEMARQRRTGASALTAAADAHRRARAEMERIIAEFRSAALAAVADARTQLHALPPATNPIQLVQRWNAERSIDGVLRERIRVAGEAALRAAEAAERQLNEVLETSASSLRKAIPPGGLAGIGRDFRGTVHRLGLPLGSQSLSFTPDNSLLALLGQSERRPWEQGLGFNVPGSTWGQVLLGMPLSTTVSATAFNNPWGLAVQRAPGNAFGDMITFGLFDPTVNNLYFFQDPLTNRLSTSVVKSGVGVGVDQTLKWLTTQRGPIGFDIKPGAGLSTSELLLLSPKEQAALLAQRSQLTLKYRPWDSQLKPGTLASIPLLIDGGMLAVDAWGPKWSPNDPNNDNYLANLGLRSTTVGLGVGVPVGLQTKDLKAFGFSTVVPAFGYASGQVLFGPEPPDPSAWWYNGWGQRDAAISLVNGVSDIDYYARSGEGPSSGNTSNLLKSITNPVAGTVATIGDAALNAINPVTPFENIVRNWNGEPPVPIVSEGTSQYTERSFSRAQNSLYHAIHEVPVSTADKVTAVTLNGFQTLGRVITLDWEGVPYSWDRMWLNPAGYVEEPGGSTWGRKFGE